MTYQNEHTCREEVRLVTSNGDDCDGDGNDGNDGDDGDDDDGDDDDGDDACDAGVGEDD